MGLFSDLAGVFSATQEARAAKEASRILTEARQQATNESAKISAQFDPFVTNAQAGFTQAQGLLTKYLAETEGVRVDEGLTVADRIAYQDASKLLSENLVSTGNLRSGAAAFSQAELLRRVVADAETRTFNQQMQKMGLLFGGANSVGSLASMQGGLGVEGKRISTDLLKTAFNLAPQQAGMEIQKGAALANQIGAVGSLGDSVMNTAIGAFAGYAGALPGMSAGGWGAAGAGSLLGSGSGGGLSQMMLMQNLFKGQGSNN